MIYWHRRFHLHGDGHYRGWHLSFEQKPFSNSKFIVTYTVDYSSVITLLDYQLPNRSSYASIIANILAGRSFKEVKEIDTYLRWPKTLNDKTVSDAATTHGIAYINYTLKDAITYLMGKGIIIQ